MSSSKPQPLDENFPQAPAATTDREDMEILKFNILPMEETERREAFKEAVNNCPLCGHVMDFHHEVDFLFNKITEDCRCQECALRIRTETYDLQ